MPAHRNHVILKAIAVWPLPEQMPPAVLAAIACHYDRSFSLPTQTVLSANNLFPEPRHGSWWERPLYLTSLNEIVNLDDLQRMRHADKALAFEPLSVVQLYDDIGDDGHTFYNLEGHALFRERDAAAYVKAIWQMDEITIVAPVALPVFHNAQQRITAAQ